MKLRMDELFCGWRSNRHGNTVPKENRSFTIFSRFARGRRLIVFSPARYRKDARLELLWSEVVFGTASDRRR